MNRTNRFGRNDHKDEAATGSHAPSLDAGAEPPEGFADYEDYQQFEGYAEDEPRQAPAVSAPRAAQPKETAAACPVPPVRKAMGAPAPAVVRPGGWRWGLLAAGTAAAVGMGVGGAMLVVFGGHPGDLWRGAGPTGPAQWLDLKNHPQSLLLMVSVGSAFLAGLVGYKIARAVDRAGSSFRDARGLLVRVAALRLEKEEAWQDPAFDADPSVANFTAETLGAWRHQEARLRRMVGIEGELHRLEKALSAGSRDDIAGHYETPVVGILSDSILKIFDDGAAARADAQALQSALESRGQPLIDLLQDARGWQRLTQDQLNLQQAALERTAAHLAALAALIHKAPQGGEQRAAAARLIQELQQIGLPGPAAAVGSAGAAGAAAAMPPKFNELLDRFTKLAFQIAMEVARLGPRGERLLPMAQSLEDLTAGFRQVADQSGAQSAPAGAADPAAPGASHAQAKLQANLQALSALVAQLPGNDGQDLAAMADKVIPAAGQVAANLVKIAQSFDQQQERLTTLGQGCAELVGRTFDAAGEHPQSAAVMDLAPLDPFLDSAPQVPLEMVDPFGKQVGALLPPLTSDIPMLVTSSNIPGNEDRYDAHLGGRRTEQSALPEAASRVYDLREFGAVTVEQQTQVRQVQDRQVQDRQVQDRQVHDPQIHQDSRIFDLAEFGAVRLDSPDAADMGSQRIYDLLEFGARRVG